jgi:oligopeptidase B
MSNSSAAPDTVGGTGSAGLAPPQAARKPHEVASPNGARDDDYYWLRDDSRQDPEVLAYLARENAYTDAVLAPLAPLEASLFDELVGRLAPDDCSVPVLRHGYWYYTRLAAGREYPIYARRRESMSAPEQILLDGNDMAAGRDYFEIGDFEVSPDGRWLAYTQDAVGRRQYELRIRDLDDGRDLPDRVANVEAEVVWAADNRTVLYIEKDPETLLSVRVRAHLRGAGPGADRLLYEEADDSYYVGIGKSRSEKILFIVSSSTEQSEWRFADADDPDLRFRSVLPREAGHEYEVEHLDEDFIIRSNGSAPNFRIVRAPRAASADKSAWTDVVPHRDDVFIEDFEVSRRHLAVNERAGGALRIRIRDWRHGADGARDTVVEPPEAAGSTMIVATPDVDSSVLRYVYTSLTTPPTTYDFDMDRGVREWRKTEAVLGGFDAARYATQRRLATARDGARIPVTIAYRRGTPLDGTAPIYQYGYGAYGHSIDPSFRSSWISLMDRGFVVAIAHVRGGQELGRAWYDHGRLRNKRNTFTDFIDVTALLVDERWGAADKVCAQGGSAGGLLMGAVANMAPERYRAIVAHVPFVDVVTTMLDESIPLTTNEFDQWGDPRRPGDYEYMLSYSPYDNVRAQHYPAMLVFTGLWDSQVQYFEPAKWVARLRALKTDRRPLLLCMDMTAGHGGRSGRFQRLHETAREFAFLLWQLQMDRAGDRAQEP